MHDLPQEVHPWVRAVASYAHSWRGTIQVQVLPQVIRQVGPLPESKFWEIRQPEKVIQALITVGAISIAATFQKYNDFENSLYSSRN